MRAACPYDLPEQEPTQRLNRLKSATLNRQVESANGANREKTPSRLVALSPQASEVLRTNYQPLQPRLGPATPNHLRQPTVVGQLPPNLDGVLGKRGPV